MNFSIVIPIYNEELNILSLFNEILYLKDLNIYSFEVVFVNDSSRDNSLKILNKIQKENPSIVKILSNQKNLGQSFSILHGIKVSKYETIVTIDGDGQNNPKNLPLLLEKFFLNKNIKLVGGIRVKRKDSPIKIISSRLANNFRSFILQDNCKDTGCSLKVFDKKIFLQFPFFNGIHRFLPALFKGYGYNTLFINVDHRKRNFGKSNYGTFKRLIYGIIDIIRVLQIIRRYKK